MVYTILATGNRTVEDIITELRGAWTRNDDAQKAVGDIWCKSTVHLKRRERREVAATERTEKEKK